MTQVLYAVIKIIAEDEMDGAAVDPCDIYYECDYEIKYPAVIKTELLDIVDKKPDIC